MQNKEDRDKAFAEFETELKSWDKITSITMEINNPNYDPERMTSEGFDDRILDMVWCQAKASNAHYAKFCMLRVGNAENWTAEIVLYAPGRYEGWRKLTKKLGDWLLGI
jgi:hypothetical protein